VRVHQRAANSGAKRGQGRTITTQNDAQQCVSFFFFSAHFFFSFSTEKSLKHKMMLNSAFLFPLFSPHFFFFFSFSKPKK